MKKIIFLIVFVAGTAVNTYAQYIGMGVRGGLNLSKISSYSDPQSNSFKTDFTPGYHAGLFFNFDLGPIGLQPEIAFSTNGFEYNADGGKYIYTNNNIEIPVLLKFQAVPLLSFVAGPQASFEVSNKFSFEDAAGNKSTLSQTQNNRPEWENVNFSGVAGVQIGTERISFGTRYIFGVNDLIKNNNQSSKNQVIQFSLKLGL